MYIHVHLRMCACVLICVFVGTYTHVLCHMWARVFMCAHAGGYGGDHMWASQQGPTWASLLWNGCWLESTVTWGKALSWVEGAPGHMSQFDGQFLCTGKASAWWAPNLLEPHPAPTRGDKQRGLGEQRQGRAKWQGGNVLSETMSRQWGHVEVPSEVQPQRLLSPHTAHKCCSDCSMLSPTLMWGCCMAVFTSHLIKCWPGQPLQWLGNWASINQLAKGYRRAGFKSRTPETEGRGTTEEWPEGTTRGETKGR